RRERGDELDLLARRQAEEEVLGFAARQHAKRRDPILGREDRPELAHVTEVELVSGSSGLLDVHEPHTKTAVAGVGPPRSPGARERASTRTLVVHAAQPATVVVACQGRACFSVDSARGGHTLVAMEPPFRIVLFTSAAEADVLGLAAR